MNGDLALYLGVEDSRMEGEPPVRPPIKTTTRNCSDFLAIICYTLPAEG
jgi:hypothetical protein